MANKKSISCTVQKKWPGSNLTTDRWVIRFRNIKSYFEISCGSILNNCRILSNSLKVETNHLYVYVNTSKNHEMFVKHLCPLPQYIRIGLTFDLLTWLSTGVIYSSRTINLPSLKLLRQSALESSVTQSVGEWHTDQLTYWYVQSSIPFFLQRGHRKSYIKVKLDGQITVLEYCIR